MWSESKALEAALAAAGYVSSVALRAARNSNGVVLFSKAAHEATRVTPKKSLNGKLLLIRVNRMVNHDFGTHGRFDDRSRSFSPQLWANTHRRAVAAGLLGLALLATRALQPRHRKLGGDNSDD